MKLNKKVFAVVMGLAITASGSVFAATADSFTDVPKDHWSYQALDYLAKEGVIEGMGDSTFQGGRSMTRYEVASIVAKAMQKGNLGIADSAVLEKLEKEYGGELATLKNQVDQNTKQIAENKKAIERVNLHGFVRAQWDSDNLNTAAGNLQNEKDGKLQVEIEQKIINKYYQ
ncbi:MAG: S-layer homology domain-containing protein [Selenomonas sp.]|nr:S-layer homology domain-containing protein [Selenomonas sp.]